MGLFDLIRSFHLKDRRDLYIALTAPVVGYFAFQAVSRLAIASRYNGILPKVPIFRAPAQENAEQDGMPYPPDALPGGRNIPTPYGQLRAYEWGPVEGRKVLFIHGISTPSIALARMADRLVEAGCRVMLFDLFGRGYSDTPDPKYCRQDINLFCTQILVVLATSELDWNHGFTMCGYSLGGGIAADFTYYFPSMVESLVLIAPGGVLRTNRVSLSSKLLYSDLLPNFLVYYLVRRTLRAGSTGKTDKSRSRRLANRKVSATDAASEEIPDMNSAHAQDSSSPLFENRPHISSATAVTWQLNSHPGFIPSFVSCVKYAPIHDGHERWIVIGERCAKPGYGLKEGQVLILLGEQDAVISSDETGADAEEAFGRGNTKVVRLTGGHDVPVTNSEGCVNAMMAFWKAGL